MTAVYTVDDVVILAVARKPPVEAALVATYLPFRSAVRAASDHALRAAQRQTVTRRHCCRYRHLWF